MSYAPTLTRVTLRYAIEKFDPETPKALFGISQEEYIKTTANKRIWMPFGQHNIH